MSQSRFLRKMRFTVGYDPSLCNLVPIMRVWSVLVLHIHIPRFSPISCREFLFHIFPFFLNLFSNFISTHFWYVNFFFFFQHSPWITGSFIFPYCAYHSLCLYGLLVKCFESNSERRLLDCQGSSLPFGVWQGNSSKTETPSITNTL